MKINLIKTANNKLWPADEIEEVKLSKLKASDVYTADIKVNQNYGLHKKIFGFFAFCTSYKYGDPDAAKNEYYLNKVRKDLTILAGYYKQVFEPDGLCFELVPLSLKYERMPDDVRQEFYRRITQSALDSIFNNGPDDTVMNKLLGWF